MCWPLTPSSPAKTHPQTNPSAEFVKQSNSMEATAYGSHAKCHFQLFQIHGRGKALGAHVGRKANLEFGQKSSAAKRYTPKIGKHTADQSTFYNDSDALLLWLLRTKKTDTSHTHCNWDALMLSYVNCKQQSACYDCYAKLGPSMDEEESRCLFHLEATTHYRSHAKHRPA